MAAASSPSFTNLIFSRSSVFNTNILTADQSSILLYSVRTKQDKNVMRTTVYRANRAQPQFVAYLQWNASPHDTTSDILKLQDSEPVLFNSWIKASILPFTSSRTFEDAQGRKYQWSTGPGESLQLRAKDTKGLIASYTPRTDGVRQFHTLAMTDRALEIRDLVVVSSVFIEGQATRTSDVLKGKLKEEFNFGQSRDGSYQVLPG